MNRVSYPAPFRARTGAPWCPADEEHPVYSCAIHIQWYDPATHKWNEEFLADARGYTPVQAASRAAAIGTALASYLNTYTSNGRTRFDAHALCEMFNLPTTLPA